MAIRFYCPFCDQLLGIAQRRAGAVVECPCCHGKVGVPAEEAAELPAAPLELVPLASTSVPPDGIVLSRSQLVALLLALGLMLLVSFAVGLVVGALSG